MSQYLDKIMDWHRARVQADPRDAAQQLDMLLERALLEQADSGKQPFRFSNALSNFGDSSGDNFGVIAEIKRRSPSKGDFNIQVDLKELSASFESAGARCLSVLTDQTFFGGSLEDLREISNASSLPVLRKDFTASVLDVCDTYEAGASAVLLIMAALTDAEAEKYYSAAKQLELDVLLEVHTQDELDRAMEVHANVNADLNANTGRNEMPLTILVNQRDLNTFEEYPKRAVELAPEIPEGAIKIAASVIRSKESAAEIKSAGYNAILVGEYLMRSEDPTQTLQELVFGLKPA